MVDHGDLEEWAVWQDALGELADEGDVVDHLRRDPPADVAHDRILAPARRPDIEYPAWASVHGLAVLLRGPLHSLTERHKTHLEAQVLAFIGAAVS